jgi:NAD(P)-dependent dehydrogenase (short-subunit alcohol dehydrogenase family)
VLATAPRLETIQDLEVAQRLQLDVTDQGSIDEAFRQAGQIDALIANAGETLFGTTEVRSAATNSSGSRSRGWLRAVTSRVAPAARGAERSPRRRPLCHR